MYKILGSDGHEYGPLSAGKIKQWIADERVEKKTPVLPEGAADWVFLSSLPEFAEAFAAQEKWSGAAGKKRRIAVYLGLFLLAVIAAVFIFILKNGKHH
jgi:hypothetical protein